MRWLSGRTAKMWNAADTTDAARRREAIIYWSFRRVDLPGPIFFTLALDDDLNGERQNVLDESEACCACGVRRRYIPLQKRLFYAPAKPQLITLHEKEPPIAITLWGGDLAASMVELSVTGGTLTTRPFPYDEKRREEMRAIQQTLPSLAEKHQSLPLLFEVRLRTASPASPNPYGFEIYAVHGVDPKNGTVDITISRNCKQADLASSNPTHICE